MKPIEPLYYIIHPSPTSREQIMIVILISEPSFLKAGDVDLHDLEIADEEFLDFEELLLGYIFTPLTSAGKKSEIEVNAN